MSYFMARDMVVGFFEGIMKSKKRQFLVLIYVSLCCVEMMCGNITVSTVRQV